MKPSRLIPMSPKTATVIPASTLGLPPLPKNVVSPVKKSVAKPETNVILSPISSPVPPTTSAVLPSKGTSKLPSAPPSKSIPSMQPIPVSSGQQAVSLSKLPLPPAPSGKLPPAPKAEFTSASTSGSNLVVTSDVPLEEKEGTSTMLLSKPELAVQTAPLAEEVKAIRPQLPKIIDAEINEKIAVSLPKAPTVATVSGVTMPSSLPPLPAPLTVAPAKATIPTRKEIPLPIGSPVYPPSDKVALHTTQTTLQLAQQAVETAPLVSPKAAFQVRSLVSEVKPETVPSAAKLLPPRVEPPLTKLTVPKAKTATVVSGPPTRGFALEKVVAPLEIKPTISSPANLPTARTQTPSAKIKIPKIQSTAVKPSPKTAKTSTAKGTVTLPSEATIIPSIPISSPAAAPARAPVKATTEAAQVMQNLMNIDVKKLEPGRVKKGSEAYSVAELKAIAGSLNLIKTGSKKELVDRIKAHILKVNPTAFD